MMETTTEAEDVGTLVLDLLERERSSALVGGKAAPLPRAAKAGHAVPAGFVVTTEAQAAGLRAVTPQVEAHLARLGSGPFAVRSSAAQEDGADRSFAGQLETALDVPREGVLGAIERCWASASALRALRYGGGAAAGPVAVIVQRMIQPVAAGVAFSADPHTGEREVVRVEAVRGLGDRLVSGESDPEAWRLQGDACTRTRSVSGPVLTEAQARAVAGLATAMQELQGAPQDVEWAFDGDELVLLQSRPITALPAAPVPIAVEVPKGTWVRDDHHAVLSPLGWSWFQPYPRAMATAFTAIGMPLEGVECTRIGGHLYLRFVTGGGESDKAPPRWLLWCVSRLLPSMRRANRTARRMLDDEAYLETVEAWETQWRPALQDEITRLFHAEPAGLEDTELLARLEGALALSAKGLEHHAHLGAVGTVGLGKLFLFLEDHLGWTGDKVLDLVSGSSDKTTELHRQVEAIVERHRAELEDAGAFPRTWSTLADRCPSLARELSAWLEGNRLRMLHYDPKHPSLGERPDYVLSIAEGVAAAAARPGGSNETGATHERLFAEARGKLDAERFAEFERLVAQARRLHGLRDANGIESVSRPAGLLRHFVLELGRRLGDDLDAPEHAVYLTPDEHAPALQGELEDVRARVERRRGEESWAHQHRGPRSHGPPEAPMPPADAFPDGLARLFRVFGWMMESEKTPDEEPEGALRGVGLGARIVTGRARVIRRPEELASVRHGEIVVCRITSPEWSVGLGRVAALVTEEGGALSHPAIIAREFGVSAVLGAAGAMKRVATGDEVRVDPLAATVTIIRRSAPRQVSAAHDDP